MSNCREKLNTKKLIEMRIVQRKVMIDTEAEIQATQTENEKFRKIDINKLSQLSITS